MNPDLPPPRSANTPFLVFFGIVGLSVVFFFLFTLPRWKNLAGPAAEAEADPAVVAGSPEKPKAVAGTEPAPAPKKPVAKPGPTAYATAAQFLDPFCTLLRESNFSAAMKMAGPPVDGSPGAEFLKQLLGPGGFTLPAEGPAWTDGGQLGATARFFLPLHPRTAAGALPAGRVWLDMDRDKKTGWHLTRVAADPALVGQGTELLRVEGIPVNAEELHTPADPLQQSSGFLTGVLSHDFTAARALTNREKVTQEKLAGLCIVFEEGGFELVDERPVLVTAAGENTAWAIARVRSKKENVTSELGLEMHRDPERGWMIEAIDFSRLLESHVQATHSGETYYSPIVKSPQGGESLVLYFDFDSAAIVPRAQRQLEIVAGLLATDPARKLRITGHADDIGSDDYNLRLSADRAKNVRAALHALSVDPEQIQTIGFGATAPLVPNQRADGRDDPDGRSQNRRTEIYLDF